MHPAQGVRPSGRGERECEPTLGASETEFTDTHFQATSEHLTGVGYPLPERIA